MDLIESSQMTLKEEMAHWWIRTRFFYLDRALSGLGISSNSEFSVLEIGCGTAQNLRYLRQESDWSSYITQVVGVDPALSKCALDTSWLREKDSIRLEMSPRDELEKFDLLVSMDVLEHMDDDEAALREWLKFVRPGGWVFIAVPAFQKLWSRHDEALDHKRRYHLKDLHVLAAKTGLNPLWTRYGFSYIFPFVYLIRKLRNKKAPSGDTDLKRSPFLINFILEKLGKFEALLGGNPWFGTSAVGLFQKPIENSLELLDAPSSKVQLSIVIPAFNEERRLPNTLEKLAQFSSEPQFANVEILEIIVVDDGSTDQTAKVIRDFQKQLPSLQGISLSVNRGKGFAVRSGVLKAKGDYVLVADADMSTPWEETYPLLEALTISKSHIAMGSRGLDESRLMVRQGFLRETLGKTFNYTLRLVTGLSYKDTQCGFKLMKRSSIFPLLPFLRIDRFAWDVEFLVLATLSKLKIVEVPVRWQHCEESRVRIFRDGTKMVADMLWLRFRYLFFKPPFIISVSHKGIQKQRISTQVNSIPCDIRAD